MQADASFMQALTSPRALLRERAGMDDDHDVPQDYEVDFQSKTLDRSREL